MTYELIDLAEVNLPFLDEPLKAALRQYRHEHTKAWSRQLPDHLEVVITDDDVDENWQLRDLDAVMAPYHAPTRAIDAQMAEALG